MANPSSRIGRYFLLTLAIICIIVAFLYFLLNRSLPSYRGTRNLLGLKNNSQVQWDTYGVPWIDSANLEDAYRVQGYVTARDRFFQMELVRRKMSGTLSEIFGPQALNVDIGSRKWNYHETAKLAVTRMSPAKRQLLEAYAEGVNQYLQQEPSPWECLILNFKPHPWKTEDTFLVVLSMYESLNAPMSMAEEALAVLRKRLSPSLVSFFTPDFGFLDAPILPDPLALPPLQYPTPENFSVRKRTASSIRVSSDFEPGSNAWVISGKHSVSGFPLLASDPHLELRVPNIWYRLGVKWPEGKVLGASIPGIPGIVIGRNEEVAWAFTNSSVDNIDRIEIPTGSSEISIREELIPIKGQAPARVTFKKSPWGPVIDESTDSLTAIEWTALDPDNLKDLDVSQLNNAKDTQELLRAFGSWAGPPQNALFATRRGDIGWTLAGRLPHRIGFDGLSKIQRNSKTKWSGYVERSRFPVVVNPRAGFIASANQRTLGIGKELPLFGSNWPNSARAKRITDLLQSRTQWDSFECSQVQADNTSLTHLWYRDQLLACPIASSEPDDAPWLSPIYQIIRKWDGTTSVASSAFPILRQFRFEVFAHLLSPIAKTISEQDEDILVDRLSRDSLIKNLMDKQPRHLLSPAYSTYCAALQKSMVTAARKLVRQPEELNSLRWGTFNRSDIAHPLSRALPSFLHPFLNMPPTEMPGDSLVPNVMTPRNGASMRLVMDLSSFDSSLFNQPGGQSGHPLSQHYRDFFPHWVRAEPVALESNRFLSVERFVPGSIRESRD